MAPAMAWFQDQLYVGTAAPVAQGPEDLARVFRYAPETDSWTMVFESPVQPLDDRMRARAAQLSMGAAGSNLASTVAPDRMGREFGIRSMVVFQGKSDPHPCLYCGTMSIWGGTILRSEDGVTFDVVAEPGIGDDRVLSVLGLSVLDGVLYAAPAGTITEDRIDRNLAPEALVHACDDPAKGQWRQVNQPAFGDPVNTGVVAMAAAHGFLYAGTGSPRRGFQLWRTDGKCDEGAMPVWERVLIDGAYRFNLNYSASRLCEFKGDLYLGTGITGFGYDTENDVGPSAAELIRVHPDGSWDLIAGELRFTPDGLKVPLAAMGPGFSNPYNSVIWSLSVHRGSLYLGMHNWEPNAWAMAGQADQMQGGYQLWASQDGDTWENVLDQGHGKAASVGIRAMCSTPKGLFLGTTNYARLLSMQAQVRSGYELDEVTEGFDVLLAPDEA